MLNEPNTSSPANVDASILYQKYKEANDKKKPATTYAIKIKAEVIFIIYTTFSIDNITSFDERR